MVDGVTKLVRKSESPKSREDIYLNRRYFRSQSIVPDFGTFPIFGLKCLFLRDEFYYRSYR